MAEHLKLLKTLLDVMTELVKFLDLLNQVFPHWSFW